MQTEEKEIILVFRYLLKLLNVHVSFNNLNEFWLSHPNYLSMVFFADACRKYNIDYIALELPASDLGNNGFPFITHLVNNGGHFVVVKNINVETENITYYYPTKGNITTTLKEFINQWGGSVFYAFPNSQSGETDYLLKRTKEITNKIHLPLFIITLFILLAYSLYLIQPNIEQTFIFLLSIKIIGLFICINILYQELIGETYISQAVCNKGEYISCDKVLQSPASQIWGIHMSDLGFIYFSSGIISLILSLFINTQNITIYTLSILTFLSTPYIIFSIYYQIFKIRKICPFCISIISILIIELFFTFFNLNFNQITDLYYWQALFTIGCLFLTISGWIIIKPIIKKTKESSIYKNQYLRFKKNPQIFNACLDAKASIDTQIDLNELIIGKPNTKTTIIYIINTQCTPCARTHQKIHTILEDFNNDICVVFRFMVTEYNKKETMFFIRLYYTEGASAFLIALQQWFQNKDYDQLIRKYHITEKYCFENELIQQWEEWYNINKISSTPTILLNQKIIDQEYDIDDIYWLVQNSLYQENSYP